jgi:hypothetical protein
VIKLSFVIIRVRIAKKRESKTGSAKAGIRVLMIFDNFNQPRPRSESAPLRAAESTLQHCMRFGRTETSTIRSGWL